MTTMNFVRLLLETRSPMAINSGSRETGFDQQLVRDANGLPMIPSSSFTGVWRHKALQLLGKEATDYWFGSSAAAEGSVSARLMVHQGLLVDGAGQPVQGLLTDTQIAQDPLLQRLHQSNPMHRERVRINDRGVAADMGKFDTLLLPRGLRFVIDIRWVAAKEDAERQHQWQALLGLLNDPSFALGAFSRNGLGKISPVASEITQLELTDSQQAASIAAQLTALARRDTLPTQQMLPSSQQQPFAQLEVSALDTWRAGSGTRPLGNDCNEHTDSFVFSETAVHWIGGKGVWSDKAQAVFCGSSIKGILAHRTAYHYRRLQSEFADNHGVDTEFDWESRPTALAALFGSEDPQAPLAGRLVVDDCIIHQPQTLHRTHTSIDRFTGGVRQGVLYSEEVLWQPTLNLTLHLLPGPGLDTVLQQAFNATLMDLKLGLLPLGAGSGRGDSLVCHGSGQTWQIDDKQLNGSAQE